MWVYKFRTRGQKWAKIRRANHFLNVFHMDLRRISNYFPIQHKLTGFYNRGRVCLLRGTSGAFKSDRYSSVITGVTGSGSVRYFVLMVFNDYDIRKSYHTGCTAEHCTRWQTTNRSQPRHCLATDNAVRSTARNRGQLFRPITQFAIRHAVPRTSVPTDNAVRSTDRKSVV
jgi:hypothetical protein